jgi:hypothetical protein
MKNKFLFILIGLLTFSGLLLAQTPGYMGKRFVIGYGFHTGPALIGSTAQGSTIIGKRNGNASEGEPAFNSLHEAYIEAALSKRFLLGLSTKFYKTTYDNHKSVEATVTVPNQYGGSYVDSYYGYPEGLYYIKGQNYALYGKLFKRGFIAPWGKYMMFGVNINRFTCSYDPAEMKLKDDSYNSKSPPVTDFGAREQSFTKFDLLFGYGRTRVVANRVTFDYGFNVNLIATLNTLFDAVTDDDTILGDNRPSNYNYIETTAPWRVRGVNRFNVYLRVGVLLF